MKSIFPEALKRKAMRGDFISMQELFKCKIATKDIRKKVLKTLLNDEDDGDDEGDGKIINWSQFKSLVPDLIYLYISLLANITRKHRWC